MKIKIMMLLFCHALMLPSDHNDYVDFLKNKFLILSAKQKIVFNLFVQEWKKFLSEHGSISAYTQDSLTDIAWNLVDLCHCQIQIDQGRDDRDVLDSKINRSRININHIVGCERSKASFHKK